jgi:raffinose/stachyose/melibiose transport system permease protein
MLGLVDTVFSLIPVYIAMGLPMAVFVLTSFMRGIPHELIDAAHVDGASEWRIYASIMLPLVRPALATVIIFNLIPIWNDLWFPLIFIRAEEQRTVILGVSLLFGQYQSNWTRILSALTLSALPILVLYLLMSKQFIKGLTAGAVKG